MNKYLILLLLPLMLAACNPSGDSETANDILPTIVPTIVIPETVAEDGQLEEAELPPSEPGTDSSVEASGEAGGETPEDAASTDLQTAGNDVVDLDDFLLYDEPPGMDYRTTLTFSMTADGNTIGSVFAEGSRTVAPNASTMTFNMIGGAGGGLGETMTVTQIEDQFYYVMPPNDCISLAGEGGFENPFDLFLDTGGFLTGEAERVLPDETINGVDSYHYQLGQENLSSWAVYEVYAADLYVAKDGGYVTRLRISGYGVNEVVSGSTAQEGNIDYELNNIPQAVPAIAIPAGCEPAAEINADYPVLADATAVTSGPGLFSYETQTSFADVIAFYKENLDEWTVVQEIIQEPNATITFTGPDGTLMVNLGPGQNGGVLVGIIATP